MAKQSKKSASAKPMTYAGAGVDIEAGDRMVSMIQQHMRRTYSPRVLGQEGGFAGCFRLDYNERLFKRNYRDPVLVACTDGVGTKVLIAAQLKIYDTVGQDLVAMSVNDMIVQGAEPLFFLDYIGTHKLDPETMTKIVKGVADGCHIADCSLLGGETAEMPDVYDEGDFDLAGFAVGVCERKRLLDGSKVSAGDKLIALPSAGVHSNGYSLVRRIIKAKRLKLDKVYRELDEEKTLGEVLLTPTRIYSRGVNAVLRSYKVKQPVTAMSHITGGGLPGNIPRTLNGKLDAYINTKAWDVPTVFDFLQERGNVERDEMFKVFNMGVGYVIAARPHFADAIVERLQRVGEKACIIGELQGGSGNVILK